MIYRCLTNIYYEPRDSKGNPDSKHWRRFNVGDEFEYPTDVSTPSGSVMDVDWMLTRGYIEEVNK
jgi:hypothetical protein